jgi:hypothetical protein
MSRHWNDAMSAASKSMAGIVGRDVSGAVQDTLKKSHPKGKSG